jgi:hypothetical protein
MTRYTFHFYRANKPSNLRQVYVWAESPRDARALFESLYPLKFFAAFGVSSS